jgi:hypothetical protein
VQLLAFEDAAQPGSGKSGASCSVWPVDSSTVQAESAWKMKTRTAAWTGPNTPSVAAWADIRSWHSSLTACSS